MSPVIAKHSLIGNVSAGVSLEFNEDYAKRQEALGEACKIIEGLLCNQHQAPVSRKVYNVCQTIPLTTALPAGAVNFKKSKGLDFFPFLLGEKSYTNHQGFAAESYDIKEI